MHSLINTLTLLDVYSGMKASDKYLKSALSRFEEFDKVRNQHSDGTGSLS